ncbi:hypothetical protein [Methylobacterium sp. A54F]
MIYATIAALGISAGMTVRWPILLAVCTVLASAVGLTGALHAEPLVDVLWQGASVMCVLDISYLVGAVIVSADLWQGFTRKT